MTKALLISPSCRRDEGDPSWASMEATRTPTHTTAASAPVPRRGSRCAGTAGRPKLLCWWRSVETASVFHDGARALADLLPQVSVETLPGQDHGALWMAPEAVVASARHL